MQSEYYEKLKQETKKFYSGIGSISCPVLNNEKVFFTKAGFNHLIRKGRIPRLVRDQIRRLHLFRQVVNILKDVNTKVVISKEETAMFWKLSSVKNGRLITVVIRKLDNTEKHFFSVMDRIIH